MNRSGEEEERDDGVIEDWIDEGTDDKLSKDLKNKNERDIHHDMEEWDKRGLRKEVHLDKPPLDGATVAKKRLNYVFDTYCMFKNFEQERLVQKNIARRVKRLESELDKVLDRLKNLQEPSICKKCSMERVESPCCITDDDEHADQHHQHEVKTDETCGDEKEEKPSISDKSSPVMAETTRCDEGGENIIKEEDKVDDKMLTKEKAEECKDKKHHKCPAIMPYHEDEPYIIKKPIPTPRVKKPKIT